MSSRSAARNPGHPGTRRRRTYPAPTSLSHSRLVYLLEHMIQPEFAAAENLGGARIAVCCRSADPHARLGGDWYVSVTVGDELFIGLGDVAGHGLSSVGTMLRMRYLMTAYAMDGHPPATVLAKLNALLCASNPSVLASAVAARYRPADGLLVWASAGHPAPLLRSAGTVHTLPVSDVPRLGSDGSAVYRSWSTTVEPQDTVLLHTNGMSVQDLARQLAAPEVHPTVLLGNLEFGTKGDDATVLVLQPADRHARPSVGLGG